MTWRASISPPKITMARKIIMQESDLELHPKGSDLANQQDPGSSLTVLWLLRWLNKSRRNLKIHFFPQTFAVGPSS
jgi:hypothetical protein